MTSINTIEEVQAQTQEIIAISQYERIIDAAKLMHEERIGCLVVAAADNDETMVGIITERDILGWISTATPKTYFQEVHELMTKKVIHCLPDTPLDESVELMRYNNIRHMPTVVDGKAIGMLSVRDLLERRII